MKIRMIVFAALISAATLFAQSQAFDQANEAYNAGDYPNAKRLYARSLQEGANRALVFYNLGTIAYIEDDVALALQYYKQVIPLAPFFVNSYLNIGKIYFINGEYDLAVDFFRQGHEAQPEEPEPLILLGDTYNQLGVSDRALWAYRQAQRVAPDAPDAYHSEALLFLDLNSTEQALAALRRGFANNPRAIELVELEGDIYRQGEDYFKAAAAYQSALNFYRRQENDERVFYYTRKVAFTFYEGEFLSLALDSFQDAHALQPRNSEIIRTIGFIQLELGNYDDAYDFFLGIWNRNLGRAEALFGIKQVLSFAFNEEDVPMLQSIISFYRSNNISDEVYERVVSVYEI